MNNVRNFDTSARTWDEEPRRVKLADTIATAIAKTIPLSPDWDGADIGCGTGLVTLRLAPQIRTITGIDSSCGMLDTLSEKIRRGGIKNVRTLLRDLSAGEMPDAKYHIITSAMTLHHIQNPGTILSNIRLHLHPGGWLALADLDAEDGHFHDDTTGVFHNGFSSSQLTEFLKASGYTCISVSEVTTIIKADKHYPVLLAIARA